MSIGRKFMVAIGIALMLVTAVTVFLTTSFERREEEERIGHMSRMAAAFTEQCITMAMLEKNDRKLDKKLTDIKNSCELVLNIWVVDRAGTVRHATDPSSRGSELLPSGFLSAPTALSFRQFPTDPQRYRSVQMLANKPACHQCHGSQARYNGAIVIDLALAETNEQIRKEVQGIAAILLAGLFILGGLIALLWKYLVSKRLQAVIGTVRQVREGIFGAEFADRRPDELTGLEADVNRMAQAIQARDAEKESLVSELTSVNAAMKNEIVMRMQSEAMLQEQKIFSDALVQSSAVATFVLDTDHRVIIWNKACERLTGVPAASMVGTRDQWRPFYRASRKTLADVVLDGEGQDLSGLYQTSSRSTLSEQALHAEGWYENLNGKGRYIIFDAAPIHCSTGELCAVMETLQDVTGQKQMENALVASEAKLRTIIETEPECVKLMSLDGVILEMNRAGLDLLEAESLEQIIGRPMLSFITPEHQPSVVHHLGGLSRGEQETASFEIVGLKGTRRWLESRGAPLRDGKGEVYALLTVTRDVTERQLWERRLQEQLQFMQTLMQTIPMPVFYKDRSGRYQGCNKAFEEFLGITREQLIGKTVYDIAPTELADEYRRKDNELFANPGIQVYEHPIKRRDGSLRHVIFNKATFSEENGIVTGMLGVMHDITERKQAEAALQESETRFRELAGLLPQPIYEADLQGTILFGSRSAFDYFGYGPEELGQVGMADLLVPEDRERAQRNLEELLRGAPSQGHEYRAQRKNGAVFPVLVFSAAVVRDGKPVGFRGVILDISERKRVEDALVRTNETLQALFKASPLAVVTFDAAGMVGEWNPAAQRIFGWPEDEVKGRFNPIVPSGQKQEFLDLLERVMHDEILMSLELVRQRKDGTAVTVSLSSAPIRNERNEITGIISMIEDITDRKRAETIIRRNYDTQTAINWILHISLENLPVDRMLKQALDLILSIPWLSFESRGAIFLVPEGTDTLVMEAERGLSAGIKEACRSVPFGKCLCGRAAARGEVTFADHVDDRHEITYAGMGPHGHYCVPIKHGPRVLGVITIYIKEGHVRDQKEVEFLDAIAKALAGVIRRSRAEQALKESEKRYRSLAEAAHDVIFIVDREGRIEYINSFGAELFGRKGEELRSSTIEHLFRPVITEAERAHFAAVLQTGHSLYTENIFAEARRGTWLGTWLVPLKDDAGHVDSVLGVARDITERKRTEEERGRLITDLQGALNLISRSHKEWQDTFDSIRDMIAIIDKDFRILKANTAFAAYFGLHPKDVIQKPCYQFHHRSSGPVFNCPHVRTLSENGVFSEEMVDAATNKVLRLTTFPYCAPDGTIIGSIHISRDVTGEKEQEMRLIMSERLAALGQMASGIAHEINNPLASIAGCSEGLLSRIKKDQYDRKLFETYLNIIQEETFRCKSITTAMLSFVRKTTYEKKEMSLNQAVDRTMEILSFQGRMKGVEIVRRYQEPLVTVSANEGELRQVFLVLLTNALDAMQDKGTLTLETGNADGKAFVRITDSGPGIAAEHLNRIFDPFFTTKAEQGGTGLGLSIARKIMMNHNGSIEASSVPDQGSTFTVTLPA